MRTARVTRGRSGRLAAAVAASGALVAMTSCSAAPPAKPSPISRAQPISFTLAEPAISVTHAAAVYALESGIWAKMGLNVTIDFQGAIENTLVAAGRDVAGGYGPTGMFPGIEAGHEQSIIFSEGDGNPSLGCDVSTKSPFKSILDLGGQPVGVLGVNGATYGAVSAMSAYIEKHGKKPVVITVEPSSAALVAATESGAIAAGCESTAFASAEAAGLTRSIIRASSPLALQITNKNIVGVATFGLNTQLAANSSAIVRLVAGERVAEDALLHDSNAQVAAVLAKYPAFAPSAISRTDLIAEIAIERPFFATNQGFISKKTWAQSLKAFEDWGLNVGGVPVQLSSPKFSYQSVINMSYWNKATPLVSAYLAKYGSKSST
jgi:hypothetical protein